MEMSIHELENLNWAIVLSHHVVLSHLFFLSANQTHLFQVLAIIAAILLIRAINEEKRGSLDTTNSNVYRKGVHEIALPDSKPR